MRKLIMVHGRSQEGKDPVELKWTWVNSWKEGLAKSGLELPLAMDDIAFPYYGDILDKLIYDEPDGATALSRGPEDNEELAFKQAMIEAFAAKADITADDVREATGSQALDRGGPFDWPWVHGILRAFDKKAPISGLSINLFTHDVYLYCKRPGVRDTIDNVVRDLIKDGEETVVVGHSLGSIVTYSVLARDESRLKVPLHVTVGSPMALQLVQDQYRPTIHSPKCVTHWYNALDPRDIVALFPLSRPHFNVTPEVENKLDVDNFTYNRHGIIGYLSDKDVAKKIYDGVVGP